MVVPQRGEGQVRGSWTEPGERGHPDPANRACPPGGHSPQLPLGAAEASQGQTHIRAAKRVPCDLMLLSASSLASVGGSAERSQVPELPATEGHPQERREPVLPVRNLPEVRGQLGAHRRLVQRGELVPRCFFVRHIWGVSFRTKVYKPHVE